MKRLLVFAVFSALLASSGLSAPLEFVAEVEALSETGGQTFLTVKVTPTVSINVLLSGLTEITDETGLPVSADALAPGQLVKIEGLFTDLGILALEIEMLGQRNDFELRGEIEEIDVAAGLITLLGLPIQVGPETDIKDEFGRRLDLDELEVGDLVKVEGMTAGDSLVADDVTKLTADSFARISFLAVIDEFPADDQFMAVLDGGIRVLVELTEETEVRGTLAIGAVVKVIGLINPGLFVTALKIHVTSPLIQLSPPKLKMGFEQTRRVDVILREALGDDLLLQITSRNSDIAGASSEELMIPEGELTAYFEVTSGSVKGRTWIDVVSPDLEGAAVSLEVEVKEGGPDEDELEIKWTPRIIRSDPRNERSVSLFLKKDAAPANLTVSLSLVEGPPGLVEFPSEVEIPEGERRVRFDIQLLSQPGKAVVRAALPEEHGGDTDDLLIELGPGQRRVRIDWTPGQVKTEPLSGVEVVLKLSQPAPFPVTVSLSPRTGNPNVVTGFPSSVTFAEGEQEVAVHFSAANQEGRVTYRATLPDELGRGHDDLRIVVKEP